MKYVLVCNCMSEQFIYDNEDGNFKCTQCNWVIPESEAGHHLLQEVGD